CASIRVKNSVASSRAESFFAARADLTDPIVQCSDMVAGSQNRREISSHKDRAKRGSFPLHKPADSSKRIGKTKSSVCSGRNDRSPRWAEQKQIPRPAWRTRNDKFLSFVARIIGR